MHRKSLTKVYIIAIILSLIAILCVSCTPVSDDLSESIPKGSDLSILMRFHEEELIVDMYDNSAAKSFISLLPLTMTFDDYNPSEKTSRLADNKSLNITDAPSGYAPKAGEIGYYSPWRDVVIYHRDFSYASGIVPLGKVRNGIDKIGTINGKVEIEFTINTNNL